MSNSLQPLDCSTPGFPVLHYFLEFAQIHVHWISEAIQPSHPLLPPSPLPLNLSQHQGLFQWVGLFTSGGQSIRASASASVLPMNIQDRLPLELTGLISLQSGGLSRLLFSTTIRKHQFFSVQPSLWMEEKEKTSHDSIRTVAGAGREGHSTWTLNTCLMLFWEH